MALTLCGGLAFVTHAQAVRQIHRSAQATMFQASTTNEHIDAVGDTMTFKVVNTRTQQVEDIDFELMAVDPAIPPRFQVWVELAELDNGTVDQAVLDSIMNALGERTPAGSINPNAGIVENNETIFGDPPDTDGDGITDVLLLDIRDNFDEENNPEFLRGFVTLRDLSAVGNNRDVLYIDTNPTLTRRGLTEVYQTAANKYQMLIHFKWDPEEITFINEGLSEWAEVALGYQGRTIDYLDDPARYNVPLLDFQGGNSSDDRQRGGLFINYIADRFGPLEAGKITRQAAEGTDGLRDALINMQAGISLEELIFDFHTANFFNDTGINPRYGYTTEQRQGLRAVPSARFDGLLTSETPMMRAALQKGGVQYLLWEQVEDFTITLSAVTSAEDLRAEAFLFSTDGSFQGTTPLNFTGNETVFSGEYDRVVAVLAHVDPDGDLKSVDYGAQWNTDEFAEVVTTTYDDGQVLSGSFFELAGGADAVVSTRFATPCQQRLTLLDKVMLAPFYANQFVDGSGNPRGSPSDPRDFTFYVWGPGSGGQPGDVLFEMKMDDPRAYAPVTSLTINFFEVDLTPYAQQLSNLPDPLYLSYGEAGQDDNNLVIGVSSYTTENVSFLGRLSNGSWTSLWDTQVETVIPVRTTFVCRNRKPVATIATSVLSGEAPLMVVFDASASSDADGVITSYAWDFGDGTTGSGVLANHTYEDAGEYIVTLTVTDNDNGSGRASITIAVSDPPNQAPTASQITSPDDGAILDIGGREGASPLPPDSLFTVTWTEASDPDNDPVSYTWELADSDDFAESSVLIRQAVSTATRLEMTLGSLATVLDSLGGGLGTSLMIWHRVVASDSLAETPGEARQLTLVRGTLVATEHNADIPMEFALEGNYPNPFNPSTVITYALPQRSAVSLTVYDVQGRRVVVLMAAEQPAGWYAVTFEGSALPSGVYFYRLEAKSFHAVRPMLLLQ